MRLPTESKSRYRRQPEQTSTGRLQSPEWKTYAMLAVQVSNRNVGCRIAVTILLLTASLPAQRSKGGANANVIARAKRAIISSFDPALPNLTLESFLNYETGDRRIDWEASKCKEDHPATNSARNDSRCITAYSSCLMVGS